MVQDVSDQMFQIFSQRMRAELETPTSDAAAAETQATPSPPPTTSEPEALDMGAIGTRAAIHAPAFWVAIAGAPILVYLLLR